MRQQATTPALSLSHTQVNKILYFCTEKSSHTLRLYLCCLKISPMAYNFSHSTIVYSL